MYKWDFIYNIYVVRTLDLRIVYYTRKTFFFPWGYVMYVC